METRGRSYAAVLRRGRLEYILATAANTEIAPLGSGNVRSKHRATSSDGLPPFTVTHASTDKENFEKREAYEWCRAL